MCFPIQTAQRRELGYSVRDFIPRDSTLTVEHEVENLGFHLCRRHRFDNKASLYISGI